MIDPKVTAFMTGPPNDVRVHGEMEAYFELSKEAFHKFKESSDMLAEAWRAFAREVVKAQPLPDGWKPTPSPVQIACRALFTA